MPSPMFILFDKFSRPYVYSLPYVYSGLQSKQFMNVPNLVQKCISFQANLSSFCCDFTLPVSSTKTQQTSDYLSFSQADLQNTLPKNYSDIFILYYYQVPYAFQGRRKGFYQNSQPENHAENLKSGFIQKNIILIQKQRPAIAFQCQITNQDLSAKNQIGDVSSNS